MSRIYVDKDELLLVLAKKFGVTEDKICWTCDDGIMITINADEIDFESKSNLYTPLEYQPELWGGVGKTGTITNDPKIIPLSKTYIDDRVRDGTGSGNGIRDGTGPGNRKHHP